MRMIALAALAFLLRHCARCGMLRTFEGPGQGGWPTLLFHPVVPECAGRPLACRGRISDMAHVHHRGVPRDGRAVTHNREEKQARSLRSFRGCLSGADAPAGGHPPLEIFIVVGVSPTKELVVSVGVSPTKKGGAPVGFPPPRIGSYPHCKSVFCPSPAFAPPSLCFVRFRCCLMTEMLVRSLALRAAFARRFASSSVSIPRHS
jgi:hypothetical protein